MLRMGTPGSWDGENARQGTAQAEAFLTALPGRLSKARPARARGGRGGRLRRPVQRRLTFCRLSDRATERLLLRLDCDRDGMSLRSGQPAWPESWNTADEIARALGASGWMVMVLASWLEGLAETTRRTYASHAREVMRDLRISGVEDLGTLPEQAVLTWQRSYARRHLPRTVNTATGVINSLMRWVARLGVFEMHWEAIPNIKVTRGRWIDRDAVVLSHNELLQFWQAASDRPRRQFLALMLASLHGLRACEVARLRWGDLRYQRRGQAHAPAVIHIIGKGRKHRVVQLHPNLRPWLESERRAHGGDEYVLADDHGKPPSAQTVSWWAKDVFERTELKGYAHALRATWATMALENRANSPLEVQQSGGWKSMETMTGHYLKRRTVPLVKMLNGRR